MNSFRYKTCVEYAINNLKESLKNIDFDTEKIFVYQMSSPAKLFITYFNYLKIKIEAVLDWRQNKIGEDFGGIKTIDISNISKYVENKINILCEKSDYNKCIETLDKLDIRGEYRVYSIDIYNFDEGTDCLDWSNSVEMVELSTAQREMLKLMEWFDKFCDENGIYYVLYSGSLIGAVRHKGFIPWDDDIDVIIPAKDYLKCCKLLSEIEMPYEFESILDSRNCCISTISKLVLPKYRREERNFPMRIDMGIGIDIWPLGGFPNDVSEQQKFSNILKNIGNLWKEKIVIPCGTELFALENYYDLVQQIEKVIFRYDIDASKYVSCIYCGNFGFNNGRSRIMLKEDYLTRMQVDFDGVKLWIPNGYDKILQGDYGDYWIMPSSDDIESKSMNVYHIK